MHPADSLETRLTAPRIPPTRPPFALAFLGAALLGALFLEACADETPTAPEADLPAAAAMGMNADGTRIVIEPHWLTLNTVGISGTLTAVVTDAAGDTIDDAAVTWESAEASIATVDTAGVVTSADFGRTRVTATYDSATAWATVEVASRLSDREILEVFYEATGGDEWADNTNWLSDEDLSEWHGVGTDEDGRVRYLEMPGNELTGAIPAEIGGLGRLEAMRLGSNRVSGAIPAELGKLTRLEVLGLDNNELAGGLPPEMGGMKVLKYLDVAHNRNVVGIVPHTFAGLDLGTFYSTDTELCVPPSLKDWFDEIPATDNPTPCTARIVVEPPSLYFESLGDTATLSVATVGAEGDTLHGTPGTWASADDAVATVDSAGLVTAVGYGTTDITATADSLTGSATVEVGPLLADREILEIFYEALEGDGWADNTNWLSDEELSEWYGVDTDGDGRVIYLDLTENELAGAIPAEIGGLGRLEALGLGSNRVSGAIPAELGKLTRLELLDLNSNELAGGLPPEMGGMKALNYIDVAHNRNVMGIVPHTFAGLDLGTFYSADTELCVPPSLKDWFDEIPETDNPTPCTARIVVEPPSLYFESLGDTATLSATAIGAEGDTLHGASVTWTSADAAVVTVDSTGLLTTVGYGVTDITATADSLTGSATVEVVFALSDRDILETVYEKTGGENWTDTTNWLSDEPLSEWFGIRTNEAGKVDSVGLGGNNMSGSIPPEIGELDSLLYLDLSRNELTGPIPGGLGALKQLSHLRLNNNALEGRLPARLGDLTGLRHLHIDGNSLTGQVPGSFANLALESFQAAGSGVCVPPSLDEWYQGIGRTDSAARCMASITIEVVSVPSLNFYATGETARLAATYVNAEGDTIPDASVTWSSGDTAVASVDATGLVTAVGDGETEITAAYDSTTGTIPVTVALPQNDRDVLEIFYEGTGGPGWTEAANWTSDKPLAEWAGVETDDGGRVTGLSLPGNNLRGPLHSSIGQLDRLVTLDLSRNWVSGSIPAEVGDLSLLRELALSVNALVGELPSVLGGLDNLRTLKVAVTRVSGPVPASFADLELDSFLVNGTALCLPPSLSDWLNSIAETDNPPECAGRVTVDPPSLTFAAAGDTARLSATVIDAEGDVVNDAEVTWTSGNTLVASVDPGTGLVTARAIGVTAVTATYDSATTSGADVAVKLPGGDRVALEALYRATGGDDWNENTNWLSDEPLDAWDRVKTTENGRIRQLFLNHNNLTGPMPAAIGLLDSLVTLDFDNNSLTGAIPPAVARLQNLERLYLGHNNLSGSLPPEMGNMSGLRYLEIHNTGVTGPVPDAFANLRLNHFTFEASRVCFPRSLGLWLRTIEDTGHGEPPLCIPETPDRDVLVAFYNSTGGPNWWGNRNWLGDRSINTWDGIVTDAEGYVTEIILWDNNLDGPIPPEFGNLSRLEVVNLSYNRLSGKIPPEMGNLENLVHLGLSENRLEGAIPLELGNLNNLVHLGLYENRLEGAIPPELGNLPRLIDFYLSENRLTGSIPPELANLSAVEDFGVQNNRLTGSIPPEFGRMSSMVLLSFANNHLSGPIPPQLGNLYNLRILDVRDNQFSGSIPAEFGNLVKLERLALSSTGLSGAIPRELGNMRNLTELWSSWNNLSGSIPPELGNLDSLVELSLFRNQLTGAIPPELGNMSKLEYMSLSNNQLSGRIPPELSNLSNLRRLSLYENNLTGSIPPELANLSSLLDFWLSENQLSGTIPAELANLPIVEDFGVQNNDLSGPIPPEFGKMSSLTQLALYNNNLSGRLPPELGDLGNLEHLQLQDNPDLEGLLPRSFLNLALGFFDIGGTDLCAPLDDEFQEWLGTIEEAYGWKCPAAWIERFALVELYDSTGGESWTNNDGWDSDSVDLGDWYGVTVGDSLVTQLRLPDNGLEGRLLPGIGSLRALETLDLAGNDLTGGVQAAIASIDPLDTLRISGNEDMEGPLPFRMTDLTNLRALQYADTDICASPSHTFQDWIGSLDIADGATCDNPDSVRLSLPVVYLTQAIQRPEGDIPLLSNREALLRVFLVGDAESAFFEPEVLATFTRDGEEVHRVVMPSELDRLPTLADEGDLVRSYNAVIPAEHIVDGTEFVVVADSVEVIPRAPGSLTRFPETGSAPLNVIDVPPLELTVVPVLYADKPDSSVLPWIDSVAEMGAESPQVGLFRYSFPFNEFSATGREPYVTSLDMTNENNAWPVLLEVELVRLAAGATGYWYAVADSYEGYVRGIARLNGWVSFGKPWITELAHEVGHTLDLRHAPCGGALGTDPDFPYDNGGIGVWGYDFRDGSLVSPRHRRDIMGYCYELGWLSDYYFEKVIRVREKKESEAARARMAQAGPKGRMLVLWGGVLNGELRIEPPHTILTTATPREEPGPYRLDGVARTGEVEFSLSFTPGEDKFGNKYFLFTIPIEDDWEGSLERITLTGPEGEVTVDGDDPRSLTIVTDPATGLIRAILRDWNRPLPAALGDTDGLDVVTTRGILDAVRRR